MHTSFSAFFLLSFSASPSHEFLSFLHNQFSPQFLLMLFLFLRFAPIRGIYEYLLKQGQTATLFLKLFTRLVTFELHIDYFRSHITVFPTDDFTFLSSFSKLSADFDFYINETLSWLAFTSGPSGLGGRPGPAPVSTPGGGPSSQIRAGLLSCFGRPGLYAVGL
jgi:hypothetical protein